MKPAHLAVENEDLVLLRELLDSGADIEEIDGGDIEEIGGGVTLLQHAIDVEIDGHTQSGGPLHVDTTAYLLARGADPLASTPRLGTALDFARSSGHWLAVAVIEAHLARRQ